jgi:hypothetical protein
MSSKIQHVFRQMINHETDGPITSFVLIDRAIRLTSKVGTKDFPIYGSNDLECYEAISNALYEELSERGWIDTESMEENGS